jgi:FAD synthase
VGNLARTELTVELHDRIRDEERYDGGDEMVAQFGRDVAAAQELLSGRD